MDADTRSIGRYSIERVLGQGQGRMTYAGLDPKMNRRVAIKAIDKTAFDAETAEGFSRSLTRDVHASASLHHPNIVQVYDFGEEGDVVYVVTEFIEGRDLKAHFDSGERFAPAEAVRVARELLSALHFAHEAGIVHRDVKPGNVLINHDGRVKLSDFGVALRPGQDTEEPGTMVGTPAYMSPEQITGGIIDRRTDLFSTGIVLYQLLTGEKPFAGGGAWTIAKKIITDEPLPPSYANQALPREFDAVVQKALAKDADKRFRTAREFSDALRAVLGQATAPAPRSGAPAAANDPAQARLAADAIEPYAGEEKFIFASYKREDYERIAPMLAKIVDTGYRVWYDKGIPGSAEWMSLLEERLKACSLLIFFMSRGSVESKYCRREINYVDSKNKPILCVRLEEAELRHGLDMLLTQYQMVDATAEGFTGEIDRALKYLRLL